MVRRPLILVLFACLVALVACSEPKNNPEQGSEQGSLPSPDTRGWSATEAGVSPDGKHVAFIGYPWLSGVRNLTQYRLVLAGDPPRAISPARIYARDFAWMPDSKSILLSYGEELGGSHPNRFAIITLDGDIERVIEVDRQQEGGSGLAVSPDGKTAIFPGSEPSPMSTPSVLWQIDLSTGHMTVLDIGSDQSDIHEYPEFIDSDRVVFAAGLLDHGDVSGPGPNGWIGVVDLRSGEVSRLTPPGQTAGTPTLAPGGRFVVYDAFPGNQRERRALWMVAVDGSSPPKILLDSGMAPELTPDGTQVLVVDAGYPGDRSVLRTLAVPDDAPWLVQ